MCNNSTCYQCNQPPLCAPNDCSCPVKDLSTDCVLYTGNDLACSGIKSQTILTELIQQLDEFICTKSQETNQIITLINIGTGAGVYKGVDLQGRKEIRRINGAGDLVTVTENANDISISIDEEFLNTFIEDNQLTTVGNQLDPTDSDSKNIYKNTTVVGDVSTLNFRSLILEKQGTGESLIRDLQENTNDVKIRLKSLKSNTLNILATDTEISIEQSAAIPALYVNDLYKPSYQDFLNPNNQGKGEGTLAKPFTNTRTYSNSTTFVDTPNTAIQNALDAYVNSGSGGTRLAPQKNGQKIIVQDNNTGYTFLGDFNYTNLQIELQANVNSTTTGLLVNMDDTSAFDATISQVRITINASRVLQISGDGINNSGNSVGITNYTTGRIVYLLGKGLLYAPSNNTTKYILNADSNNLGNNNAGNLCIQVDCNVRADYQGVYKVGGLGKIDFYGEISSGTLLNTVAPSLKAFYQTGGQVRKFKGSQTNISGTTRTSAIVFEPIGGFTPSYISQNSSYIGTATNLFDKINSNNVDLQVTNSISGYALIINEVFKSPSLWYVRFSDNNLASGNIDNLTADLTLVNTVSVTNTIGNNIIESLRTFTSKNNAKIAPIPKYGAYLLQRDVSAGNLIVGTEYKVKVAGTGTPLGTLGDYFIASNNGSGAVGGIATLVERCIMI